MLHSPFIGIRVGPSYSLDHLIFVVNCKMGGEVDGPFRQAVSSHVPLRRFRGP